MKAILHKIISFRTRIDNKVRNFIPSNALVSSWPWIYSRIKAMQWLDEQVTEFPGNPMVTWSKAVFEYSDTVNFADTEKDSNMRPLGSMLPE